MSDCLSCVEIKRLWVELFNQTTICLANIWGIGIEVLEVVQLAENCPAANDAEDLSSNLGLYIGIGVGVGLLLLLGLEFGIYHFYKRWEYENLGDDIELQPIIPRPHPQPPAVDEAINILREINLLDEDEKEVLFHSPRHQRQQQQQQNPNPNPADPNPADPNPADPDREAEPTVEAELNLNPNPNPDPADPTADPNPADPDREADPIPNLNPNPNLARNREIGEAGFNGWDLDERWNRTKSGRVSKPPMRLGFED